MGMFVREQAHPEREALFEYAEQLEAGRAAFGSEVAAHVLRVSETAHWLEWQDWADPVIREPYAIRDGKLHIPDRPGLGIAWDEKAVAKYRAD